MPSVAMVSYGISAISFSALTLFLVFHPKVRTQVPGFWMASLCMVVWSMVNLLFSVEMLSIRWVLVVELSRTASWCYCLLEIFKFYPKIKTIQWFERKSVKVTLLIVLLVSIEMIAWISNHFQSGGSEYLIKFVFISNLLLTIFGFSLVEQLFRNIKPERRWGFKYFALGLGILFSYDLYMFANAILLSNLDLVLWQARGMINALVPPLIAVSMIRNKSWQIDIFPSRHVVFHSTIIVGCGLYLLLMAALGYYIRQYGGTWGRAFQIIFLSGAMVLLVSLMGSGKMRAWVKMLFGKYIFQYHYDYRKEWLKFSKMLSHSDRNSDSDSDLRQCLIMALADMVESPSGVLFEKVDNNEFTITKTWNDSVEHFSVPASVFLDSIEQTKNAMLFQELINTKLFSSLKKPWVVIALIHEDIQFAFVILSEPRVDFALNWEVFNLLQMASHQAAVALKQAHVSEQLLISSQFESLNRVSTFLMHDLKNILSQLKLVQVNYKKHGQNPDFIKSAFVSMDYISLKLEKLLNELRSRQLPARFEAVLESVNLKMILDDIINQCSVRLPVPTLILKSDLKGELVIQGNYDNIFSCISHLVENAQEATLQEGQVILQVDIDGQFVRVEIQDTGIGMSEEFMQKDLFKPFVTTKGRNGMGIGVFQAREIIKSLKGMMRVHSEPGKGTTFILHFPRITMSAIGDMGENSESKKSFTYC